MCWKAFDQMKSIHYVTANKWQRDVAADRNSARTRSTRIYLLYARAGLQRGGVPHASQINDIHAAKQSESMKRRLS